MSKASRRSQASHRRRRGPRRATRARPRARTRGQGRGTDAPRFVVEQFFGRRVSYALRLEIDGHFKSWRFAHELPAIPGARAIAIEANDGPDEPEVPLEGAIHTDAAQPVGAVMVWDRGGYVATGHDVGRAYQEGEIRLRLLGEKYAGSWTLRRLPTRSEAPTAWLAIKEPDPSLRPAAKRTNLARSVLTGRTLREIAGRG